MEICYVVVRVGTGLLYEIHNYTLLFVLFVCCLLFLYVERTSLKAAICVKSLFCLVVHRFSP